VVPVGGGGLLAGVAAAVKLSANSSIAGGRRAAVMGVEPDGAAKMSASLAADHPVTLERVRSIADGLMPVRPGDLTFQHTRRFVDRVVAVPDEAIARAAIWLFEEAKQVAEPSGAAAVAAALWPAADSPAADRAKTIVAVVSGGNVSPETLAELMRQ
jgi:threonine dehydratase